MFDEGQKLAHPYHRTKFESEKLVRERVKAPWRVYRPSLVIGDSRTGEMDKIDGPYYFFKLIQKVRHTLPEWFPLISLEWGWTNIVPVDYVAAAVDHIAHQAGLDGQAFHVVDPKGQRVGEVLNTFAEAGHAPKAVMRIDRRATQNLPKGVLSFALKLPALKQIRAQRPGRPRDPGRGRRVHRALAAASTRATPSARCAAPTSRSRRWPTTRRRSGTTGSARSTPTSTRTAPSRARSTARRS